MNQSESYLERAKLFIRKWGKNSFYGGFFIFAAMMYTYVLSHQPTQNGDDIEHLHSSFLVAMGDVPYRDFFQHHNPLLWYIFAPILYLLRYNTVAIEVVAFITFLVFLKSLVYVYRIGHLVFGKEAIGLIMAGAVMVPRYKLYPLDFRPDNYMIYCFIGGLYYYLLYLKEKKSRDLVWGFSLFFVSFLFAQKIVFSLMVIGVTVIYFLIKKEILWADFKKALVIPIGLFLGGFYYLYHYDMIELYWRSNFTFNLAIADSFGLSKIEKMPEYVFYCSLVGGVGALFSLFSHNKLSKILSFLFVVELWQRCFYFSPYSYYYFLLLYFSVLSCGEVALCIYYRFKYLDVVMFLLFWGLLIQSGLVYKSIMQHKIDEKMYLPSYVTREINPCDYVFNGDGMMFNIFGKDPAYYWQLIGQLDVLGEQVGIAPKPNINELIVALKPKFIYGMNYYNKFSSEDRKFKVAHYVDMNIVNKYYQKSHYDFIYKLKPEYDTRKCIKDRIGKKWNYVN